MLWQTCFLLSVFIQEWNRKIEQFSSQHQRVSLCNLSFFAAGAFEDYTVHYFIPPIEASMSVLIAVFFLSANKASLSLSALFRTTTATVTNYRSKENLKSAIIPYLHLGRATYYTREHWRRLGRGGGGAWSVSIARNKDNRKRWGQSKKEGE